MSEQSRIEQDLEQTRSRMNERLNALQDRLTPDRIVHDVMSYVQGSDGGEFASNLMAGAKRNPLPAALTGIGLAWLMASNARDRGNSGVYRSTPAVRWDSPEHIDTHIGRAEASVIRAHDEDETTFADRVTAAKGNALGVMRSAQDTGADYTSRVADAVTAAKASVTAGAHDARDRASELTQKIGDSAQRAAGKAAEHGRSAGRLGSDTVSNVMDNPIILGAIGLGVGALLGALVPQTEAEENALGDMAQNARHAVKDVAQQVVDRGGAAAQKAVAAGKDSADAHGMTGQQDMADLAHDAASGRLTSGAANIAKDAMKAADDALRPTSKPG